MLVFLLGNEIKMPIKAVVISSITSLIVSVACILGWNAFFGDYDNNPSDLTAEVAARERHDNIAAISAMRSELNELQEQLAVNDRANREAVYLPAPKKMDDLLDRIEAAEDSIEQLYSLNSAPIDVGKSALLDMLAMESNETAEDLAYSQYTLAESNFDNDTGVPLGDYVESIDDALYSIGDLDVKEMNCRTSICKVVYSEGQDSVDDDDSIEWQLMEKLLNDGGSGAVDIRYANDPSGNKVMYIQLL